MEFDDENIIINNIDDDVADTPLVSCTVLQGLGQRVGNNANTIRLVVVVTQ